MPQWYIIYRNRLIMVLLLNVQLNLQFTVTKQDSMYNFNKICNNAEMDDKNGQLDTLKEEMLILKIVLKNREIAHLSNSQIQRQLNDLSRKYTSLSEDVKHLQNNLKQNAERNNGRSQQRKREFQMNHQNNNYQRSQARDHSMNSDQSQQDNKKIKQHALLCKASKKREGQLEAQEIKKMQKTQKYIEELANVNYFPMLDHSSSLNNIKLGQFNQLFSSAITDEGKQIKKFITLIESQQKIANKMLEKRRKVHQQQYIQSQLQKIQKQFSPDLNNLQGRLINHESLHILSARLLDLEQQLMHFQLWEKDGYKQSQQEIKDQLQEVIRIQQTIRLDCKKIQQQENKNEMSQRKPFQDKPQNNQQCVKSVLQERLKILKIKQTRLIATLSVIQQWKGRGIQGTVVQLRNQLRQHEQGVRLLIAIKEKLTSDAKRAPQRSSNDSFSSTQTQYGSMHNVWPIWM